MVAKPIKVVQMLPELQEGGVERGTLEMGAYLTSQGHDSVVVSEGGRMVDELIAGGSRHIILPVGRKSPVLFTAFFPLRRFLAQEAVDILHVRSRLPAWLACWVLKSLSESRRPRFVTTFHGFYSVNGYSSVMTKGERVIAISRGVADHIRKQYKVDPNRIVLIHRGVDETRFDPSAISPQRMDAIRKQWRTEGDTVPLIVLFGRLTPWKGHDLFIQALSRITDLPWTACCVGDDKGNRSHVNRLKEMVSRLGLDERIRFVGHCEDIPAAMLVSDVVVSASSSQPEAFGRVTVEAQAMGKPVVATAHGGSIETVLDGETGWLVPPHDIDAMADAMAEAIQNEDMRQRFGAQGRKWVMEHFTTRKMCRKTLSVYEALLNRQDK